MQVTTLKEREVFIDMICCYLYDSVIMEVSTMIDLQAPWSAGAGGRCSVSSRGR